MVQHHYLRDVSGFLLYLGKFNSNKCITDDFTIKINLKKAILIF